MSVTPRGMSVQEFYRLYRESKFLVNRKYQRKLVWTLEEKAMLIDSILQGYPIPLILLAEKPSEYGPGIYEIIDGIQRLNAISSFIEMGYPLTDGRYFNISEFTRAKQVSEEGGFENIEGVSLMSPEECANFLDYQLAVTIYPASSENEITDVFGRINSLGKQLSPHERRQAGILSPFAEMVRKLAAELRGDTSMEVLNLLNMPEISIDTRRSDQGYGLRAEETFWCKQGVLSTSQLRNSEDEEILADIVASIILEEPIGRSRELLDELYDPDKDLFVETEEALLVYGMEKLTGEIIHCFSLLRETIEECSEEPNYLRNIVNPGTNNPVKTAFYVIFMAFYQLIICESRVPDNPKGIMVALENLQNALVISAHYSVPRDRIQNIAKTKGLIQDMFVKLDRPQFGQGPGLAIEIENSLRRSSIETTRYECKQGILSLDSTRNENNGVFEKIINTICAIANIGPSSVGFLFIGVTDKESDAKRIQSLDNITPIEVGNRFIVGIERECCVMGISLESYVAKLVGAIRSSSLSDPLRTQVLTTIDTIKYKELSVIRITIPSQNNVSFVGNQAYIRHDSQTIPLDGQELLSVSTMFAT
ncbi:MAG: DUF262 domain-containing protein [Anaerolineaceae bacterium]|nr:DUF262 domain-containing protein [Anaerolineaceae bacterium]